MMLPNVSYNIEFIPPSIADGFFVVLSGSVVVLVEGRSMTASNEIVSGAGRQQVAKQRRQVVESRQVSRVLSAGRIFGKYCYLIAHNKRQFCNY